MEDHHKKTISLALALLMVLSLVMVPGVFAFSASAEEAGPVVLRFHYSREDGAYEDWDLFSWGANTGSVGFIVRQGGDSWKAKDPDGDRKTDVSDVLSGTVHVYAKTGSALEDFIVDKSEAQVGAKVTAAVYDSITDVLTVTTAVPIEGDIAGSFVLESPAGEMKITGVTNVEGTSAMLLVPADPDAPLGVVGGEEPVEEEAEKGFCAKLWESIVNFFSKLFGKK